MSAGAADRGPAVAGARLRPWWDLRRVVLAAVVAGLVAAVAFLFRFNVLGGALGGFDNDHFIYLIRAEMLVAGEQPLRDFVDAELRGAWPALTYAASAWAQRLGGPTLLPEAYLTVGLLALAHALVFVLALDLSRRWVVAALAAALTLATMPKLYNYPKVLALACGVWAVRAAALQPTTLRLALAALVTAAAVLFRHDLGIYVAAAMGAALGARDIDRWRLLLRHVGIYGALTIACLLPSVIWVQVYEGLPKYIRDAAASVAVEQGRTNLRLPPLDLSMPLAPANLEVAGYYAFWAVPIAGAAVLLLRLAWWRGPRLTREERATAFGLLVMAALANLSFLRANLAERFGDAVVAVALLAAWIAGTAALWRSAVVRRLVVIAPSVLLLGAFGANYILSEIGRELDTSGLSDSWEETARRYRVVQGELRGMPPVVWADADARGTLVAARYVAECTRPTDRLLGIGPVHEIHVFARRRFAAGQAMFKLSLYTSDAFQRRALDRLAHESVPLVIADVEEYGYFDDLYPLVARHLTERYRDSGTIAVDGRPRFRVLVSADREPTRADPVFGLPCFA
jgi:hypothetical protein